MVLASSAATDPTLVTIAVVAAALIAVAVYRRHVGWQPTEKAIRREVEARLAAESQVRDELKMLLAQITDTSARATAALDARLAAMRELLAQADRDASTRPEPAAPGDGVMGDSSSRLRRMARRTTRTTTAEVVPPPPTADDTPHQDVYHLADAGRAPVQVAQALRRPLGEIELVLNLRKLRESDAVRSPG